VLDIGMNAGLYTWLASAIAPELRVIGVDMQPLCMMVAECGLRLANRRRQEGALPANVTLLRRYVSSSGDDPTVSVPGDQCEVMASPSETGGTRADLKQNLEARKSKMLPIRPLALGQHLLKHFGGNSQRAAVVKIDTEGFETRVLESLRPAWHLLGDIVFELQVDAWAHHGVSQDDGLRTLQDLIRANRYRIVTLPHTALGVGRGEAWWRVGPEFVDPCRLPHVDIELSLPPNREWYKGLRNATVMHGHQLEALIRGRRVNGFHEFLLTRRWEGCTNEERDEAG